MAKITIKYVGPLKEVTLDIKRINVFMGPQSTGKSTIAKIMGERKAFRRFRQRPP